MRRFILVSGFSVAILTLCFSAIQAQSSFTEDFTTTTYRDTANTTADWNTGLGELRLFNFALSPVGSYDTAGNAVDIVVSGDLAFVADPPSVVILDIGDPANPALLGTYASTNAQAVYYAGDLLYVADGTAGLTVVDVTDPTTPALVANVNTPGNAADLVVEGDVAYVADSGTGLLVFDVSNPSTPTQIGSYNTPNQAHGVDVSGNTCYIADRTGSGLIALDVTDPTNPTLLGGLVLAGDTWNVSVDGDLAYVSGASVGLQLVDVSDPANPTLLGTVDPGHVRMAAVEMDKAYVAGYGMVHVIDVSDPTNPTLLESWDNPGIASAVAMAGDHAFVADGAAGGVQVLAARRKIPDPVVVGGYYPAGTGLYGVAVAGDHAFLANAYGGLRIADVSDPETPTEVGAVADTMFAWDVAVDGDYAFVAAGSDGLRVIDISDPTNPSDAGYIAGSISDLALSGNHVFGSPGLRIIDVSDPTNPALASYTTALTYSPVAVSGDLLVGSYAGDLRVVDISNLASPVVVGTVYLGGSFERPVIEGDYAFAGGGDATFRVIDISNPASPTQVGELVTSNNIYDVEVSGDVAVLSMVSETWVVDISDVTNPVQVGSVNGSSDCATIAGDYLFQGGFGSHLRVLPLFQDEFDFAGNQGQSVLLDAAPGTIVRARLTTTETGSVDWFLGSEGGATQSFAANGQWNSLPSPVTGMFWRSVHKWSGPGVNPTVSDLHLEWLYDASQISAIEDVPDDQGGWVRVHVQRSGYDFSDETTYPVTGYQIYQRVDPALEAAVLSESGPVYNAAPLPGIDTRFQRQLGERRFVIGGAQASAGTFPPGTWEAVTWVAATQSDNYTTRVPTTVDSAGTGVNWSVYLVTTHTTTPSMWFVSNPDSGYSVDNIAPGVPQNLAAAYNTGNGNQLTWDPAPEQDFQYYRIYRDSNPGFVPGPANFVEGTVSTNWTDPDHDGGTVHYKVTAVDDADNESAPASPGNVTAVGGPAVPQSFALHQNVPNPFNPTTRIRYDVPPGGGNVTLQVFDVGGRFVRTLVEGWAGPGQKSVTWDGRNEGGQVVATGVYYYRMRVGSFVQTRTMLLLK